MKIEKAIHLYERKLEILKQLLPLSDSVMVCEHERIDFLLADMTEVAELLGVKLRERDFPSKHYDREQYIALDGLKISKLIEKENPDVSL